MIGKLLEDDLNKDSNIVIPIDSIPEYSSINKTDYRLDYASKVISNSISGFSNINWTDKKESDPDYSNFTSAKVLGDDAIKLANILTSSGVRDEREDDNILRMEIPGFNDCQLFFVDAAVSDSKQDELVIVVRPLQVRRNVIIEI